MFRILHLSDIHIGKTYKETESIACKIASDIDYNGLSNIDCVVVTGDIFDGQIKVTNSLMNEAVSFFEILLQEINSNQEKKQVNKEDFIFVPGNHDLIRVDDLKNRWSKYHSFLVRFYGNIPEFYNKRNYSLYKEYKEYKVAFVGFNSCQIEKRKLFDEKYINKFEKYIEQEKFEENGIDKSKIIEILKTEVVNEYDDYGYIPLSQITPIERKVKKLDEYTIVALFHHHFYLFPEVSQQFGDSSIVRNYAEVKQHLRYMNVSIVLHGHKHFALERPFIMEDYYDSADNIIDVFAGGSVGTDRKDEHTFAVLDLYEKKDEIKLKHNKFIYNGENLEPIVKKQVPPQKNSGRIIKLIEVLKTLNPEMHHNYEETAVKAFKSYDNCCKIISWVSESITGFDEVYKHLDQDYNNILFLLYAINYRTIYYMKIVGKEDSYYESASAVWDSYFESNLSQANITITKDQYYSLFKWGKLKDISNYCDILLNNCNDKQTQVYLAFSMLGIFFSDLYLVLTKYADDFKESIKYKVNIKIEENKFHENVPAPRIVVWSDADRRTAYIDLLCNEATAHKMAVLFIKEFDLMINKFEDYFKIVGLKLYYILPRIDKNQTKNTLDNYNFEAYIPTLIPLLTGDNIYSSKVVFARELIQNSIDAISVREAKDTRLFSKRIIIELREDRNRKRYFKIIDNGTGMDRYKIERYFTSIGRSFYSGDEYKDLNISYKPISNFGIGFLSSFMVCQEIDVKTKYYLDNSEGLKLHIPNYDGCFFIELDNDANIGTELKLYINKSMDNKSIIDYIIRVMQDIKYTIEIRCINKKGEKTQYSIPDHSIRRKNDSGDFKFFVPFLEDGKVGTINYLEEVLNDQYISKYEYGLLIRKKDSKSGNINMILNSGIVVEQASLRSVFGKNFHKNNYFYDSYERERTYNDIIINFPANWLQLDVARENITGLSDVIKEKDQKRKINLLGIKIANNLYNQILEYIKYSENRRTNIPAIYLQDVIQYAIDFCGNQKSVKNLMIELTKLKYVLTIEYFEDGLCYKIIRGGMLDVHIKISYFDFNAKEQRNKWLKNLHREEIEINSSIIGQIWNESGIRISDREIMRVFEDIMEDVYMSDDMEVRVNHLKKGMRGGLKINDDNKNVFKLLTLFILDMPDEAICKFFKKRMSIEFLLEKAFLQFFSVGAEETQEMRITYDELLEIIRTRK